MLKISVYSAIAALVIHCSALAPPQIPFESNGDVDTSSIWTLSTDARYSARVKTPHLCDESGKSYSGYLSRDDGAANLFFWYFPTRKQSESDSAPLSLWLNGGPGSSSLFGLGYGVGPCHIEKSGSKGSKLRMAPNKYPWTDFTNVLFIDQPIGTGFSYGTSAGFDSSNGTAEDVYALIQMFSEKFGHREVQINSLSYGGHYVPTLATVILDHNDKPTQPHVNLTKVSIGNGWFAAPSQYRSFVELPCEGHYKHGKLMMQDECQYAYARADDCDDMLKRCQSWHGGNDTANAECAAVGSYCWDALTIEFDLAKLNEYDLTRPSPDPIYDEEGELVSRYYSQKEVQIALGALPREPTPRDEFYSLRKDPYDPVQYEAHSGSVGRHYHVSGDKDVNTVLLLKTVLERGVQVLMYEGMNDWVCGYPGIRSVVVDIAGEQMWPSKTQDMHRCKEVSGTLFCYAEIEDAGHMAISDRPKYMQNLGKKWTFGKLHI